MYTPKDQGDIEMFRGKEYGGDRRGWVWGGAVPLPNGGLGAVPQGLCHRKKN